MEIKEYLAFVSQKLKEAEDKGDKEEWIRLAEVLIAVLQDKIKELEKRNEK